jgi:hypothetical protein
MAIPELSDNGDWVKPCILSQRVRYDLKCIRELLDTVGSPSLGAPLPKQPVALTSLFLEHHHQQPKPLVHQAPEAAAKREVSTNRNIKEKSECQL